MDRQLSRGEKLLVYLIAIALLLAWGFITAPTRAHAEYIPYGHGCVTTTVILPGGQVRICTTCPESNGTAITICQ